MSHVNNYTLMVSLVRDRNKVMLDINAHLALTESWKVQFAEIQRAAGGPKFMEHGIWGLATNGTDKDVVLDAIRAGTRDLILGDYEDIVLIYMGQEGMTFQVFRFDEIATLKGSDLA